MSIVMNVVKLMLPAAVREINDHLRQCGIYEFLANNRFLYVGGSLPSYIISKQINKHHEDVNKPHDIDVYTSNHNSLIRAINADLSDKCKLEVCGALVNCTMTDTSAKIQFITAETSDFKNEVVALYDCEMVRIGYHPFDGEFIFHHSFIDALYRQTHFNCSSYRTDKSRQDKLTQRAHDWYGMKIQFNSERHPSGYIGTVYSKPQFQVPLVPQIATPTDSNTVLYNTNVPSYLQLFHHLYRCIRCNTTIGRDLICPECKSKLLDFKCNRKYTITILGGINGLGQIMSSTYKQFGHTVYSTSRNADDTETTCRFELNQPISDHLYQCIDQSDILILNATKTLENDESVWNTTLDTFNLNLLMDRINTNVLGYIKFLQELFAHRRTVGVNRPLKVVYMDANESKYQNKMIDGKHLELNIAKSAVKQIFYTNANLFKKLNMSIVCYDPGWLSYHGISIEKKRSRSRHLIPPAVSSIGLLSVLEVPHHKIADTSVYDYISS